MKSLRVIPGAVGQRSLRALVLVEGERTPELVIHPREGGQEETMTIEALDVSSKLQDELKEIHLFLAKTSNLEPGTHYELKATLHENTQEISFRTLGDPTSEKELKIAVASCFYGHFKKDHAYLSTLQSSWCRDVAFKMLLGDNLYVDVMPDQSELDLWGGNRETVSHYLWHFWASSYADVLSYLPTFTTWDDHEFWNNYPEDQIHLSRTRSGYREEYEEAGQECLEMFQVILNPEKVELQEDDENDLHRSFRMDNTPAVSFFVADVRSQRTKRAAEEPRMMPEQALEELEDWATELQRPGVLVLGQPLWIERGGEKTDYNPPDFTEQYKRIWQALRDAPFDILVVSGDVHHSRVLQIGVAQDRFVYEFVTSPACHIPHWIATAFENSFQGKGSLKVPGSVEVSNDSDSVLKPWLHRYYFGTNAPNSIGTLTFRALSNKEVDVGCAFLDCETQQPANSKVLKRSGAGSLPPQKTENNWCYGERLFRLQRRN